MSSRQGQWVKPVLVAAISAQSLALLLATAPAGAQDSAQNQGAAQLNSAPAQVPAAPPTTSSGPEQRFPSPTLTVTPLQRSDDGQNVSPDGVIDGTSVKQFLNSGPQIDATQMEEASIPADNLMQMPNSVDKKKKKPKKGFFGAIGRGWVNTCNAIGFPVGGNDDIGIDASLSSDLPQAVRDRDGAYNPNK